MGYAQMLAGIDAEKVVDVVHSYAQHLNRKEVSLTWRALVSQYQAAAAKGQPRTATLGGPQGAPHGHHGEETAVFEREEASMDRQFYEQDDSLPPTPKSSLKDSELSQEFQNDGYGTALKEVMSFIDKRMREEKNERKQSHQHHTPTHLPTHPPTQRCPRARWPAWRKSGRRPSSTEPRSLLRGLPPGNKRHPRCPMPPRLPKCLPFPLTHRRLASRTFDRTHHNMPWQQKNNNNRLSNTILTSQPHKK